MKIINEFFFAQHFELKKKGKPIKAARQNGLVLLAACLVLLVMTVFMLLYFTGAIDGIESRSGGRSLGKLLGLLLFATAFGLVWLIYGRGDTFQKIMSRYDALEEAEQQLIAKRGNKRILIVFFVLLGMITVMAFSTLF